MTSSSGGFDVVPEEVQQAAQIVLTLSKDLGSIVSAGAATARLAGSGNAGFLTTPAMAALTASHVAALKNLGSQLEQHGEDLKGAAQTYQAVDRNQQNASITSVVPVDRTWSGPNPGAT